MKAVIIGPAHPYRGGIADTNESLGRALQRAGYDVEMITFSLQYPEFLFPGKTQFSDDPAPQGMKISRMINSVNPLSWVKTASYIKRNMVDLVVFRYWIPLLAPAFGTIARLIRTRSTVIAIPDNIIPHEKRFGDVWLTKYFTGGCDGFIPMSTSVQSQMKRFSNRQSLYLPHPINDNLGHKIDKFLAREKLGLDKDGKYLLFFGLVRKYKGLDLLLEALSNDLIKNSSVKLLVVGEFYDDPKFYNDLIDKYGIADRVIVKNEFVKTEDIKYYFSAIDLVTQTYHTATQSGITQVAYNFDCPMLVTNVGGLPEMVPDQLVGYVVDKNSKHIAQAIDDFFANDRFAEFSDHVAQEKLKYSWDNFAEKLIEFVMEIKRDS
ncbi:MAG: glycosyltransferase [Bacteroidales bacterium]|nr:glycosyltransferase [Bacteroidales bacterium]